MYTYIYIYCSSIKCFLAHIAYGEYNGIWNVAPISSLSIMVLGTYALLGYLDSEAERVQEGKIFGNPPRGQCSPNVNRLVPKATENIFKPVSLDGVNMLNLDRTSNGLLPR